MYHIILDIPEEVLYDTQMNHEQASQFARLAVAVSYYQNSGVSVGYCAQIAGMNKEDFIKYLGENGISVFHFLFLSVFKPCISSCDQFSKGLTLKVTPSPSHMLRHFSILSSGITCSTTVITTLGTYFFARTANSFMAS